MLLYRHLVRRELLDPTDPLSSSRGPPEPMADEQQETG